METSPAEFLPNILLLLAASVVVVGIFKKLNLSPVLGYFAAGAIIGVHGLNIIKTADTELFADFGVIFLLFAIGLELTFERLKAMRLYVFGFGTLQVVITSVVLGYLINMLGVNIKAAMIIGGGLAMSSTAVVLQVIAENRQQSTQVGRLSLSNLLMQDFAVVPLLVLIPLLSSNTTNIFSALGSAFVKALIALLVIFMLGRLMLRPFFKMITSANPAKTNELFVATTLLIALGAAWSTEYMGLSHALGAFVAGLLVAETEFQRQAEESIYPFKGLFLGLFFMTVGMSIDINMVVEQIGIIALCSLSLLAVKALIIIALSLIFRLSLSTSIHTGLLLSQGGEFGFILFNLAMERKLIDSEFGQLLLAVITVTMALTPLLSAIGSRIATKLEKKVPTSPEVIYKGISDLDNHVIVIGFGRVGKMVARLLEAENVNYVAIDVDTQNVEEGCAEGFPLYAGNGAHLETLKALGIERARSVIITVDNEVTLQKTAKIISKNFPDLPVVVRSKDLSNSAQLYQAGAKIIVPETYETGLQLGGAVLKSVGISESEVSRIKNQFRAGNYILAKEPEEYIDEEYDEENLGYDYMGQLMMGDDEFKHISSYNISEQELDSKKPKGGK
ncbi:Glutathione-regulated potassium-efflux system protein KefC [Rickettsiales bacterium Ac37b]|nr:Glutathione-regulated potassium-efflux system protein KefC [Rickettsiales bacterium Ac37b]